MTRPLDPAGTLRAQFASGRSRTADIFRRLGVGARRCDLGDQGLYLAEELVRADAWLGGGDPEALAYLVLALMIAQRQGSTRLPLDVGASLGKGERGDKAEKGELRAIVGAIARAAGAPSGTADLSKIVRAIGELTRAPRFNSVVGVGDARLPLVVDNGYLYTERSRWLEIRVAARLAARLAAPPIAEPAVIAAAIADVGARPGAIAPSGEQLAAIATAVGPRLAIVTGGPGTGKTLVAASIVRALARIGAGPIALAAQTGKAANRLTQVIAEQLASCAHTSASAASSEPSAPIITEPAMAVAEPRPSLRVVPASADRADANAGDLLAAPTAESRAALRVVPVSDEPEDGDRDAANTTALGAFDRRRTPPDLALASEPSAIDRVLAAAPPTASTLHRLLGARDRTFAHHAQSPLPIGALIIDEASMIDLELMDAVLDALPASAPLILIGDAHQLPAIDAGQVLADLARPDLACIRGRIAVLEHSHRLEHGRDILAAAAAVRAGHADQLTERTGTRAPLATARTPGTLTFSGAEWIDPGADRPLEPSLAAVDALWHRFDGPRALALADRVFRFHDGRVVDEDRDALAELWQLLARARALTVTRSQPTGSLAVNAHLHARAIDHLTVAGRPEFAPGEPVMITANDYTRGLFNGDQGIVVRADEGTGGHRFRAIFRAAGGELAPFAIEALRDRLELAWALTVHKSQGSELDAVAIVLPLEDVPLLTRELLYTAITRARHAAIVVGSRKLIAAAGKRGALRDSGLADRLTAAMPPAAPR